MSVIHESLPVINETPLPRTLYSSRLAALEASHRTMQLAVVASCVALLAVLVWTYGIYRASVLRQPAFIAVTQEGQFRTVDASTLRFRPTDQILRGALMKIVKLHYERIALRVREDYAESLYFIDRAALGPTITADKKSIQALLANQSQGEEVRVDVLNVVLRNTDKGCANRVNSECMASVPIVKTYYARTDGREVRRANSSIELTFSFMDEVTDDMVRHGNPAGLVISALHEYESFQAETGR